ncbi:MAG: hypothetical protein ACREGB_04645, partial [Candidatus Saccharimonadales bacterium]
MAAASVMGSTSAGRPLGTIVPDPTQRQLLRLETMQWGITAVVQTHASAVPCPNCRHLAARVHSRYTRAVADIGRRHALACGLLPPSGACAPLLLRRFFC